MRDKVFAFLRVEYIYIDEPNLCLFRNSRSRGGKFLIHVAVALREVREGKRDGSSRSSYPFEGYEVNAFKTLRSFVAE